MAAPADKPRKTEPVGLGLEDAAKHVGVKVNHFRKMVKDGLMPKPRMMGVRRKCWDRVEIESFFRRLPREGSTGYDPGLEGPPEP